ncbi:hypothetical protein OUZ56_007801 [Daphnia magna]|uniref:Uncharacterized protein n=1 Tax=Daphnia magna TaxID=35525 RepID=A0ABR0ABB9_9CRUS|nr:hypothetical protein OUZ56_007801 [Daphnia magna]
MRHKTTEKEKKGTRRDAIEHTKRRRLYSTVFLPPQDANCDGSDRKVVGTPSEWKATSYKTLSLYTHAVSI